MKKNKYSHSCCVDGSTLSGKRSTKNSNSTSSKKINKKKMEAVYTRYYKNQIAALYKAVHG